MQSEEPCKLNKPGGLAADGELEYLIDINDGIELMKEAWVRDKGTAGYLRPQEERSRLR